VLVFDQFEEIFTLGQGAGSAETLDELAALIENRVPESLRRALDDDREAATRYDFAKESCKVILALREDFLPALEGLRRRMPSIMDNRMRLTRMNGSRARDAIVASGGRLMATGVAEKVIAFVAARRGRTEEEPVGEMELAGLEIEPALLSIVCSELNNKRICLRQAQITADLLEGAQQEIVGHFYESSLSGIGPALKLFIEERLLTAEGYRDSRPLDEALREPGVTQADIDTLVARRLLRLEERYRTRRVELTHDLLTGVIRHQRDLRREQAETEARVQAQRERADRAEAEAERERVEREAQQKLAREAAERERLALLATRRTRIWLAATAAVLLIALSAMGLAVYEGRLANTRAEEAARSYALALKAAGENVRIVDSRYKKGAIDTEVAKSLLDAASATFAKLPSERESVETIRLRIKLFSALVETYRAIGNLGAALDAAKKEESLAGRVAETGPDGQRDLATAHLDLGNIRFKQNDLTDALVEYRSVQTLMSTLTQKNPSDSARQYLATAYISIGNALMWQGNSRDALPEFNEALRILGDLAEKEPDNTDWQREVSVAHKAVGWALTDRGDLAHAITELQESVERAKRLMDKDPQNTQLQLDLSSDLRALADALYRQRKYSDALARLREA
jgi:tetratricopeptide (TPR) repeat protein